MPAISVGLPVYNGEKLLRQAIESHLTQTFSDFELIICDNQSTDDSEAICREYAERDARVAYHRNERNIGAAANFRRVFELSNGEYFKWAGVDDHCAPTYLERCKDALDADAGAVLACAKVYLIDENGDIIQAYDQRQALSDARASARFIQFQHQDGQNNTVYGLIRADALRQTSVMGSYTGSDVVLMSELALHGRFIEIPEYLFYRRVHPEAYSAVRTFQKQQEFYNPGEYKRSLGLYYWRRAYEYTMCALRHPLSLGERWDVMKYNLRMMAWKRRELIQELKVPFRKAGS